jgi:class 3 adenylate cyclase
MAVARAWSLQLSAAGSIQAIRSSPWRRRSTADTIGQEREIHVVPSDPSPQRRLAAILAADVVGNSRLVELDDGGTIEILKQHRKAVLEPLLQEHYGRLVKVMGDGTLLEFASAVNAVAFAVELQKRTAAANHGVSEAKRIVLRIGVNLGDVVAEGDDLYGDGDLLSD